MSVVEGGCLLEQSSREERVKERRSKVKRRGKSRELRQDAVGPESVKSRLGWPPVTPDSSHSVVDDVRRNSKIAIGVN